MLVFEIQDDVIRHIPYTGVWCIQTELLSA